MLEHPDTRTLTRRSPHAGGGGGPCAAVDVSLEAYVDDALTPAEHARLDAHFARCAACRRQRDLAARVRTTLRALPHQVCPPLDLPTPAPSLGARFAGWRMRLPRAPHAGRLSSVGPLLVAALVVVSLAAGILLRPAAPPAVPDEVVQAEAEVKLALAYLGRIGERTGDIVAQDVLEARVAVPIVRSVRNALGTRQVEPTP